MNVIAASLHLSLQRRVSFSLHLWDLKPSRKELCLFFFSPLHFPFILLPEYTLLNSGFSHVVQRSA